MAEPAAPGIADWEWIASLDRTIEAGHAWPDSSITWASVAGNANQPDEWAELLDMDILCRSPSSEQ